MWLLLALQHSEGITAGFVTEAFRLRHHQSSTTTIRVVFFALFVFWVHLSKMELTWILGHQGVFQDLLGYLIWGVSNGARGECSVYGMILFASSSRSSLPCTLLAWLCMLWKSSCRSDSQPDQLCCRSFCTVQIYRTSVSLRQTASFESSGHFSVNEVTVGKKKKIKIQLEEREVLSPGDRCYLCSNDLSGSLVILFY